MGVGTAYCFAGVKFQAILHGIVCGLFFTLIGFLIGFAIVLDWIGALVIGLIVGAITGYFCFKAKRIVSCVLGVQFGLVGAVITYLILFSWWAYDHQTIFNIWVAAFIIASVYLTCTRPKAMLIEMTAVIGSTQLIYSILDLAGSNYIAGIGLW